MERIETDTKAESVGARQWRLDHLADYQASLPWLRQEAEVIDSVGIAPHRVADIITARVRDRRLSRCPGDLRAGLPGDTRRVPGPPRR